MNINDLMKRYNIKSRQGIRQFVLKHLSEINSDGEHAKQTLDGWQFDDEAVRIIDDLRGLNQIAFIETSESEKILELQSEIDNLKNLLLVSQADLIETQKKLIESEHNLLTTQRQLTDNAVVVECLENKNSILSEELKLNRQEREKIQQQLEKIKNRGILARIFNSEQ